MPKNQQKLSAPEPTGNLDSKTSAEVLGLIKRTSTEFRQTIVMITHNNDIARLADRIVRADRPSALRISAAAFWESHGDFSLPAGLLLLIAYLAGLFVPLYTTAKKYG